MKIKNHNKQIILGCIIYIIMTNILFADPNTANFQFKYITSVDSRTQYIANIMGQSNIPQSDNIRLPKKIIDKSFLIQPSNATNEVNYLSLNNYFKENIFAEHYIEYRKLVKNTNVPTDLPEEIKNGLLNNLPEEIKKDTKQVNQIMEGYKKNYISSKANIVEGQIRIEIFPSENQRAAYELILSNIVTNSMPIETLSKSYLQKRKFNDYGNISFVTESNKKDDILIYFIRDNFAVKIRGEGCFANEVLPLAKKIDEMILKQPFVSYVKLLERRATLKNLKLDNRKQNTNVRSVSYELSAPEGAKIISAEAEIDGGKLSAKDNKIFLENKKGKTKIKITAITDELLVSNIEQEINIDD